VTQAVLVYNSVTVVVVGWVDGGQKILCGLVFLMCVLVWRPNVGRLFLLDVVAEVCGLVVV